MLEILLQGGIMTKTVVTNKPDDYKFQIKWDDLDTAFKSDGESVGMESPVFCKESNSVLWPTEDSWDIEDFESEIEIKTPGNHEDDESKITFPSQRQLDLGHRLVFRFAEEIIPNFEDEVSQIFNRKGAYRRFRSFLERNDFLEAWYKFENYHTALALVEWANEEGLEVTGLERVQQA